MATVGWDCSRPTAGRLPSRGGCGEGYPADWDCLVAHRSHVATIQRDGAQVDDRPTGLLSRNGDPAPAFLRHRYDVFGAGEDKSEAPTWPAPHGRSNGPLTCLLQRLGPHDLNQGRPAAARAGYRQVRSVSPPSAGRVAPPPSTPAPGLHCGGGSDQSERSHPGAGGRNRRCGDR